MSLTIPPKDPYDILYVKYDLSEYLDPDEIVTMFFASSDVPEVIVDLKTISLDGRSISARLSGGLLNIQCRISYSWVTSSGRAKKVSFIFNMEDN